MELIEMPLSVISVAELPHNPQDYPDIWGAFGDRGTTITIFNIS
jgi:hypothetical protein